MSYKIVIEKPALKFLKKQQQGNRDRIMKAIQGLPGIGDIKQMTGHVNLYRLRVGDFRILYTIENDILVVRVVNIGNRAMYTSKAKSAGYKKSPISCWFAGTR